MIQAIEQLDHGTEHSFWCKEAPLIVDGKVKRGGMFDHQRTWWESKGFIKVLVGGYGSGKTLIGCKRLISLALQNAPCLVASVSPTYPIARTTIISTISELLHGKKTWFGRGFWWRYNKSTHEFIIKYKGREARIVCLSGDKPVSLRGPNLAAAYIDEPFIQDKDVFDQMIARVRHPGATISEIGMTGTPEELNWGYDICMEEGESELEVDLVQASSRLNLALPPGYVQRMEQAYTAEAIEAYVDGKFVNLSAGSVYYAFQPGLNVANMEMPKDATMGLGMDFNVDPMASIAFWRAENHVHFVKEFELPNSDTQYMCDAVRDEYGGKLKEVFPDASGKSRHSSSPGGKSDFWYIRQAGYTIRAHHANPHIKDRYNAVNGKLRPGKGAPTCTIAPSCKKLIKYLQTYTHKGKNKENQKAMSHLLDAMGYPLAYLFPIVREQVIAYQLRGL